MKRSTWLPAVLLLILAVLACSLMPAVPDPGTGVGETQVALAVQQTSLAVQQTAVSAGGEVATLAPSQPTYTPYPTYTAAPANTAVVVPPTAFTLDTAPLDIKELIKTSNILIYEDMAGYPDLLPIVERTVSSMNFSGGKIMNTADRLGDFKSQANSSTKWDLMIVAAESRIAFSGEMFEVMYDHINNGGAVIIEVWYLDEVANGKIAPILSKCGVKFFRDWERNYQYDPFSYSIYWLDKSHPLLSSPNTVLPPSYPYPEWFTDAGDLLELGSGGDAVLVGGVHQDRKSDYGVLASCLDGRMVIQTCSSHDYKWDIVQPLWENYIIYTLTRHYETTP